MEDEDKPEMTFKYFTGPDGKTFKLNVKQNPIKWPEQKKEETEPKRFTKTLTFKLGKKMRRRIKKYFERAGFKNKKDYLRYKKWTKTLEKDVTRLQSMKSGNNPKTKRRLDRVINGTKRITKLFRIRVIIKRY